MKSHDVTAAEKKVEQDRDALLGSIETTVDRKLTEVHDRVNEETENVSHLLRSSEEKLKERLNQMDSYVQDVTHHYDEAFAQTRGAVNRFQGHADEVLERGREMADRVEHRVNDVQTDFDRSSDELLGKFEQVTEAGLQKVHEATGRANDLLDNPTQFVRDNPGTAIRVSFLAGLVIGLFFRRRFFRTERRAFPEERIDRTAA